MLDLKLEAYAKSGIYPFHMPGHKRMPFFSPDPCQIDITEIDGFDDLHAPKGILKEAAGRAAALYNAQKSYYLVNGSTCGILAAVSAAVPQNGRILIARNSHKSVYHAALLRNLSLSYLYPKITKFGIQGAVDAAAVERALQDDPSIKAVVITSPTYEGIVSDLKSISEIVHRYGIPLIADEAHGAHFGFHPSFPQTAVRLGADLVIQSMHKVLPTLTQTALLHFNSNLILPESVETYLDIYETSSPSYVLMASMERCVRLLQEEGKSLFERYWMRLSDFYRRAASFSNIHIMGEADFDFRSGEVFGLDPSKIVISAGCANLTGEMLYRRLLEKYRLQMEMYSGFYVLGMTSIMDSREGFDRLFCALREIDGQLSLAASFDDGKEELIQKLYAPKEKKMEFWEAAGQKTVSVPFGEAAGQISGSMVCLYPPGIPILLPGEVIDADFIHNIRRCRKYRLNLQGINERINVVNRRGMYYT